ncbi:hypothetical protein [Streptomyces sp. NPDC020141]|uniref:hypothetical protein n=1 Tax=Streptomyces sp. NPDC020141 TaxID=3365065 RepID=UPI003793AC0A
MTRELLLRGLAALAGRAPVALVFLSRESPARYTLGVSPASAYVVGEAVGAPLLGARPGRAE